MILSTPAGYMLSMVTQSVSMVGGSVGPLRQRRQGTCFGWYQSAHTSSCAFASLMFIAAVSLLVKFYRRFGFLNVVSNSSY
jgi:hypothetical protein